MTATVARTSITNDVTNSNQIGLSSAGKRPGRGNISFVPIDNFDFINWDESQCRDYALNHGTVPLYIHQCFQDEIIHEWNSDLMVIFFYHHFSLHLYPVVYGTSTNLEIDRTEAEEKLLHQFTSTIGLLSDDMTGPSEYEGLLIRNPKIYKETVNRSLSNTVFGKLMNTFLNDDDEYIEIYEQKFSNKGSILEPTLIPTNTEDNRYGDSFAGFHRRAEFMMHFFIESCSAIKNDRNWSIYTMYKIDMDKMGGNFKDEILMRVPQETKNLESVTTGTTTVARRGGRNRKEQQQQQVQTAHKDPYGRDYTNTQAGRSVVCVVSMYRYLGLTSSRSRISQFFTLPSCQGRGYGAVLLSEIYLIVQKDEEVCEVNVEDPALAFVQIRDLVALKTAIESKILPRHVIHMDDTQNYSDVLDPDESPPWSSTNPGHLPEPHNGYLAFLKDTTTGTGSIFGNVSFGNSKSLLFSSRTTSGDTTSSLAKKPLEPKLQSLFVIIPYIKNVYDICRHKIKESDQECNRLAELLLLAKYLPNEIFSVTNPLNHPPALAQEPPTKKRKKEGQSSTLFVSEIGPTFSLFGEDGLRGFRPSKTITEDLAKLWANDPRIEPVKLFVKMRIVNEMDLNPAGNDGQQYTAEELMEKNQTGNFLPDALDSKTKQLIQEEWIRTLYSYLRTIKKLRIMFPKVVKD